MAINSIESIGSVVNIDKLESGFLDNNIAQDSQFAELIGTKLNEINQTINKSEALFEAYLKGENVATHDLMISMGKAKYELQLAIEIRNKLLESYQEITRIQL